MRGHLRTVAAALLLFGVNFVAFVMLYRLLTDDVLSEDQKTDLAGVIFGSVLAVQAGLAIALAIALSLLFRGRV